MPHLGHLTLDPVYRARAWLAEVEAAEAEAEAPELPPAHGCLEQQTAHSLQVRHSSRPVCGLGPHMPHLRHRTDGDVYRAREWDMAVETTTKMRGVIGSPLATGSGVCDTTIRKAALSGRAGGIATLSPCVMACRVWTVLIFGVVLLTYGCP